MGKHSQRHRVVIIVVTEHGGREEEKSKLKPKSTATRENDRTVGDGVGAEAIPVIDNRGIEVFTKSTRKTRQLMVHKFPENEV